MLLPATAEDILASYQTTIDLSMQGIETATRDTAALMLRWQELVYSAKEELLLTDRHLRDALAQNTSLRRKDFDVMMETVLCSQELQQQEVSDSVMEYLGEQRLFITRIRSSLAELRGSWQQDKVQRTEEIRRLLVSFEAQQQTRRAEITEMLSGFQASQKGFAENLQEVLSKAKDIRVKDVKEMLRRFELAHVARKAASDKRRSDVAQMMVEIRESLSTRKVS